MTNQAQSKSRREYLWSYSYLPNLDNVHTSAFVYVLLIPSPLSLQPAYFISHSTYSRHSVARPSGLLSITGRANLNVKHLFHYR